MEILQYLNENKIAFEKFEHPPLFTCEDSEKYGISIRGADTKNLFLRDQKEERLFLVTVGHAKRVDLKSLAKVLKVNKLSFGSPELLSEFLGVTPGSVTILALINDNSHRVTVVIDESIWESPEVQAHPLVNTATLVLAHEGLVRFLEATEHSPTIIEVPSRD